MTVSFLVGKRPNTASTWELTGVQHAGHATPTSDPSPSPQAPLGSLLPGCRLPTDGTASQTGRPGGVTAFLVEERTRTNASADIRGTVQRLASSTPDADSGVDLTQRIRSMQINARDILPAEFVDMVEAGTGSPVESAKWDVEIPLEWDLNGRKALGSEFTFLTDVKGPDGSRETATVGRFAMAACEDTPGTVWIEHLRVENPLNRSHELGQAQNNKGLPFAVFKEATRRIFSLIKNQGAQSVQTRGAQDLMVHFLYRKMLGFSPLDDKVVAREALVEQLYKTSRNDFPSMHRSTSMEHFSRRLGLFNETTFNPALFDGLLRFQREGRVVPPMQVLKDAQGHPVALWSGVAEDAQCSVQQYLFLNPMEPDVPLTWGFLHDHDGGMPLKQDLAALDDRTKGASRE